MWEHYLSQKRPCDEPKRIGDRKLILHEVIIWITRVGVVPLVRRETCHYKQGEAHHNISGEYISENENLVSIRIWKQWIFNTSFILLIFFTVRLGYLQPNFHGQRVHEREKPCRFPAWYFEKNRYSKIHKRFCKINYCFPSIIDGHCTNSNICVSIQ